MSVCVYRKASERDGDVDGDIDADIDGGIDGDIMMGGDIDGKSNPSAESGGGLPLRVVVCPTWQVAREKIIALLPVLMR